MTIEKVFKQRITQHQKKLAKYMTMVFNDHFVLALLILLGAGGLVYSEYVQTLEEGALLPRLIGAVLLIAVLSIGQVGTLLQSADLAFLLPKEDRLPGLVKKAFYRSFFLLLVPAAMVSAVAMPLLVGTEIMTFNQWPMYFVTLASVKWILLASHVYLFGEPHSYQRTKIKIGVKAIAFSLIIISVIQPMLAFVLAFIVAVLTGGLMHLKWLPTRRWQWEYMVHTEEQRQQRLYQFIHLFTDVPSIQSHTRRFAFLDRWLSFLSKRTRETSYYYFVRVFYRNTTYSVLVIRLLIVGGLFVYFSPQSVFAAVLSVVFLYLIGFQLLPLAKTIESQLQFQLYPTQATGKIESIKRLLIEVLTFGTLLFAGVGFLHGVEQGLTVLLANSVFTGAFCFIYLPKRLQR